MCDLVKTPKTKKENNYSKLAYGIQHEIPRDALPNSLSTAHSYSRPDVMTWAQVKEDLMIPVSKKN